VHTIEMLNNLARTRRSLVHELGRDATSDELAKKMSLPEDRVHQLLQLSRRTLSLESPAGSEDEAQLGDFVDDKEAIPADDALIATDLADQTRRALASLTPREETVIRKRFGIGEDTEHTLEEVGAGFDVTRERIRQIEVKALQKLRCSPKGKALRPFIED
jgi:RNA polymerase primary sigma factor